MGRGSREECEDVRIQSLMRGYNPFKLVLELARGNRGEVDVCQGHFCGVRLCYTLAPCHISLTFVRFPSHGHSSGFIGLASASDLNGADDHGVT